MTKRGKDIFRLMGHRFWFFILNVRNQLLSKPFTQFCLLDWKLILYSVFKINFLYQARAKTTCDPSRTCPHIWFVLGRPMDHVHETKLPGCVAVTVLLRAFVYLFSYIYLVTYLNWKLSQPLIKDSSLWLMVREVIKYSSKRWPQVLRNFEVFFVSFFCLVF